MIFIFSTGTIDNLASLTMRLTSKMIVKTVDSDYAVLFRDVFSQLY